jgi:acyl-CoA thioesterase YciA
MPDASTPSPEPRRLALRVMTLPKDTNQYGTIFGGVILSYIDQAGFVEARRHGVHRWVTVAVDRVEFKQPVHLGDVVAFYAQTIRTGTTSVTVRVEVEAERYLTGDIVPVTEACLTLVSVDPSSKPIPFSSPATAGYHA